MLAGAVRLAAPHPGFPGLGGPCGLFAFEVGIILPLLTPEMETKRSFLKHFKWLLMLLEKPHMFPVDEEKHPLSKSKSCFLNDRDVWLELKTKG